MKRGLILLASLCIPSLAQASFEATGMGARPAVLGAGYVAVANDIHALSDNPAGLVYMKRKEFSSTYALLYPGLDDGSKHYHTFLAYGHPLSPDLGTVGLSFYQSTLEGFYKERAVTVGFGKRIRQKWAVGGNIKQLYRSFGVPQGRTTNFGVTDPSKTDPALENGNSRWNVGFDLGVLYRPYYNYSAGFSVENINEPNMSVSDNNSDPVPMTIRGGLAYSDGSMNLMTALDSRKSPSGIDRDTHFTIAGEKWWEGAGFAQGDLAARSSLAFGSRTFTQLAFGFSFRLNAIEADYGFLMPLRGLSIGATQGNHRLTLTLRFGKVVVEPDYEIRMRTAEIELKKAEKKMALLEDERENLAKELETLRLEAERREIQKQTLQIPTDLRSLSVQFADDMERYWKRKSAGASNMEKISILRQIVERYKDTEFDLSPAKSELNALEAEKSGSQEDFEISWQYYKKVVGRGVSVPERVLLLNAMLDRFSKTGVDLNRIQDEINSLRSRP